MDNFKESLLEIDFSINFSLRIIHHVLFNVFYGNKHLGNLNAVNKRAERLSGYWIYILSPWLQYQAFLSNYPESLF